MADFKRERRVDVQSKSQTICDWGDQGVGEIRRDRGGEGQATGEWGDAYRCRVRSDPREIRERPRNRRRDAHRRGYDRSAHRLRPRHSGRLTEHPGGARNQASSHLLSASDTRALIGLGMAPGQTVES